MNTEKPKRIEFTREGIRYVDIDYSNFSYAIDPKGYLERNLEAFRGYIDAWEKHEVFSAFEIQKFRQMLNEVERINSSYFLFERA